MSSNAMFAKAKSMTGQYISFDPMPAEGAFADLCRMECSPRRRLTSTTAMISYFKQLLFKAAVADFSRLLALCNAVLATALMRLDNALAIILYLHKVHLQVSAVY